MYSALRNRVEVAGRSSPFILMVAVFVLGLFTSCKQDGADRAPRNSGGRTSSNAAPADKGTASPQQLVANLATKELAHGSLVSDRATARKQALGLLVAGGTAAIPAIRDFLEKNQDVYFDAPGGHELAGAPTLRLALLGVLGEIGGPEAIATAAKTFQTTADPAELATLAKFLDRAEPGRHRAEFVSAAKETLALAGSGKWDGRDVAPLFEMLRTFGGAAEITELERYANTWFDYTAITLAQWPDGGGVPTLIKLAQNADGAITLGREMYQRMLAEAAVTLPAAADELVQQTRGNKIDVAAWPAVGQALAGYTLYFATSYLGPPSPLLAQPGIRSYHLALGNQNYIEAALSEDAPAKAVGDRIRLIDRLLDATTNPAAIDALEGARVALSARLAKAK